MNKRLQVFLSGGHSFILSLSEDKIKTTKAFLKKTMEEILFEQKDCVVTVCDVEFRAICLIGWQVLDNESVHEQFLKLQTESLKKYIEDSKEEWRGE